MEMAKRGTVSMLDVYSATKSSGKRGEDTMFELAIQGRSFTGVGVGRCICVWVYPYYIF
jgi:hypothetical protein